MTYGEHGFVLLRRGNMGMHRPPLMAIQLDEHGRAAPDHRLGMDEHTGAVIWRIYPGDTIEIHRPQVPPTTTIPQGAPDDARIDPLFARDDAEAPRPPVLPEP